MLNIDRLEKLHFLHSNFDKIATLNQGPSPWAFAQLCIEPGLYLRISKLEIGALKKARAFFGHKLSGFRSQDSACAEPGLYLCICKTKIGVLNKARAYVSHTVFVCITVSHTAGVHAYC
jgi:hypothetical protein